VAIAQQDGRGPVHPSVPPAPRTAGQGTASLDDREQPNRPEDHRATLQNIAQRTKTGVTLTSVSKNMPPMMGAKLKGK
jgi:hypothetical protein